MTREEKGNDNMFERHSLSRDMHLQAPSSLHESTGATRIEQNTTVEQRIVASRPRLLRLARLNGVSPDAVEDIDMSISLLRTNANAKV